jgi:hypothetical protein
VVLVFARVAAWQFIASSGVTLSAIPYSLCTYYLVTQILICFHVKCPGKSEISAEEISVVLLPTRAERLLDLADKPQAADEEAGETSGF